MTKQALVVGGLLVLLAPVGCGGAPAQEPRTPATVPSARPVETSATAIAPAGPNRQTWELPEGPRDPNVGDAAPSKDVSTSAWAKASKVKGVPVAPATCSAFAKPTAPKPAPADLSAVFLEKDAAKRNAMLFAVESSKPDIDPVLRVMRADVAPSECADAIVDPSLASSPTGAPMAIGLSLAAKLSRAAANAPAPKDASNKEALKKFIRGPLREWMVEQATAIDALSAPAGELSGLARGIVAVEAGMADLRLVDRIRSAPTPSTWDKELKAVYEAALDEALEPRKTRGRDAALVGLADFAAAGIVHDARVDRARTLLSKLYGGRRIDALDALLLPPEEGKTGNVPETVLTLVAASKREAFAQLNLAPAAPVKSARARFEMGRRYWRQVDFVEAAHAAAKDPSPEGRLLLALSLALAKGPKNAREMMTAASPSALNLVNTDALDALAAEGKATSGMAAFDAAHLRSLVPPDGPAASQHFADVAARFEKAAGLLEDAAQKKLAKERAAAAAAVAKAAAGSRPAS